MSLSLASAAAPGGERSGGPRHHFGGGTTRIFRGGLVLVDLVVEPAAADNGGCLFVEKSGSFDAHVRIVNSVLRGCHASRSGAPYICRVPVRACLLRARRCSGWGNTRPTGGRAVSRMGSHRRSGRWGASRGQGQ